jgi:hypothetical protein
MKTRELVTICKSLLVAKQIQENNPEIKDKYISGETQSQIATYLQEKGYTNPYLSKSVSYAIKGHNGGFKIEPFPGLITDQTQLEHLANEHNVASGKKLFKEGRGVHGLPIKIRRKFSRKGGKIIAQRIKNGEIVSINASLSLEERLKNSRKAIRGRGQIPWYDLYSKELGFSAEEYAKKLSKNPCYIYQSGGNKGKVMWKLIAEELTEKFSYKFSRNSVYCRLIGNPRHKKSLKSQNKVTAGAFNLNI